MRRFAVIPFTLQFAILEVIVRGSAFLREPRAYAGAIASIALWYVAWPSREGPAARVILAMLAGCIFGSQALFAWYWHTPIDAQIVAAALHNWADVRPVLAQMLPQIALATVSAIGANYILLGAPHSPRPWRLPAFAAAVVAGILALPLRDATPDLRLVDALRNLAPRAHAAQAAAVSLPELPSARARIPNVLFVLTESVRASDACSAFDPKCEVTPEVNALLPERVPLTEMRAVASYTAVSLSAIVTGHTQEGSRADIASAPTIFEAIHAIPNVRTAYWSAQSQSVFERDAQGARNGTDSFVTLETLLGRAVQDEDDEVDHAVDRLLTKYAIESFATLQSPYFLFLHYAGTHAPYFVDEAAAPFQPYTREVAWSKMEGLHNAYRNAIFAQDKAIAQALRGFLAAQGEKPWLIVFTSDHGEAFGEHGAIHHGQNLYEEQIHVPGWIAFGNGALTDEQASALRAHAHVPSTHLDILPTLLDAYGVLDGFAFAPYASALRGASLLRLPASRPALPITNCTALFTCPINTWGMLDGDYAIEAQRWDDDWRCVHLGGADTDAARCDSLRETSIRAFPLLPNGRRNTYERK